MEQIVDYMDIFAYPFRELLLASKPIDQTRFFDFLRLLLLQIDSLR